MAEVFPTVIRDPIEDSNTLLLGREGPASGERLAAAVANLPGGPARHRRRGVPADRSPGSPGGEVYTDDRAPVEWLIDRSILGYAAE